MHTPDERTAFTVRPYKVNTCAIVSAEVSAMQGRSAVVTCAVPLQMRAHVGGLFLQRVRQVVNLRLLSQVTSMLRGHAGKGYVK